MSFRLPTGTSIDRAKGFNQQNVKKFFVILEELNEKYNFQPFRIRNVDETGLNILQNRQPQVLAKKGKFQIGVLTSADCVLLVPVNCISAGGSFIPPYFVFPQKKFNLLFMNAPLTPKQLFTSLDGFSCPFIQSSFAI